MPLVRIVTAVSIGSDKKIDELLAKVSLLAASQFGKPERWVMTCLDAPTKMTFAGTTEPCCYVEVKNIGTMSPELTEQLSSELCQLLTYYFGVHSSRVYIEFTEAKGHLWGWDGSTFA
jgi:phenylpyruvate tautomerase PptA (4-oxalocrotonate tautomerase family)